MCDNEHAVTGQPVTVEMPSSVAWAVANLVRHELSVSRHDSVLHLRCDDHWDMREALEAVANQLDN